MSCKDNDPPKLIIWIPNRQFSFFLHTQTSDAQFEEEVDLLMSSDIIVAQLVTKDVEFTRSQSGWIFREDKREMVGPFQADVYSVHGISLETKKRREHLSEEDLAKNKEPVMDTVQKLSTEGIKAFEDPTAVRNLKKRDLKIWNSNLNGSFIHLLCNLREKTSPSHVDPWLPLQSRMFHGRTMQLLYLVIPLI